MFSTCSFNGEEEINYEKITRIITTELQNASIIPQQVVGITRDNGNYMSKAIRILKERDEFHHVIDITCLSHGLNLVVKALLAPFTDQLDEVFLPLKALFKKPSKLRAKANRIIPGFYSAIKTNPTRWSGWLDSIPFIFNHHQAILDFLRNATVSSMKAREKARMKRIEENLQNWSVLLSLKI